MECFETLQPESYYNIFGWMRTVLQLKGSELELYAIIYGFTHCSEEHKFRGSLQYLSEWTGTTKRSLIANLKSLVDKGLIIKQERYDSGIKYCEYYTASVREVATFRERNG